MTSALIRILIVEDSPTDADLLNKIFSRSNTVNWQIVLVERLHDAIAACANEPFNVVLLDLSLPDSDGSETVSQFQAAVGDLPIVVLTNSDDDELALEALKLGAQDYLVKNQITIQLLVKTIRHAIERGQIIKQLRDSERRLQDSLEEKNTLIREIYHRVKNNLQIVSSLLRLQASMNDNPEVVNALEESRDRLNVMSLIHEKLYQSSALTHIRFADYVRNLTLGLFQAYVTRPNAIQLQLDIEDLELSTTIAIPCGLIINELVSNAIKYAFPEGRSGDVTIQFSLLEGDRFSLIVKDNGVGLPAEQSSLSSTSLGLRLVAALTRQLRGKVEFARDHGTLCKIDFPKDQ